MVLSSLTADMWSVGCVMAELLTGKELFKADDCILDYLITLQFVVNVVLAGVY